MSPQELQEKITALKQQIALFPSNKPSADFYAEFLGKKGHLAQLMLHLKTAPPEQRKSLGKALNELKLAAQEQLQVLEAAAPRISQAIIQEDDPTKPPYLTPKGTRHPLQLIQDRICTIFHHLGFGLAQGPTLEDDWHNFSALHFPPNHPARSMVDTFFIAEEKDLLLRTHTSSVQVRFMESNKPPIRIISPGQVFRNEAISARSHCIFHQIEGLYINEKVSFSDLKATLFHFVQSFFGPATQLRFRPSYFPFTEPSAEVDISCHLCKQKGCNVCKYAGWLEIGGAGMVDPAVLQNCHIDPATYSGFAFGFGIERMAMLYYQVHDLRAFTENDARFLQQFFA